MDGYAKHEKGGEFVTYDRLRAMGTNGQAASELTNRPLRGNFTEDPARSAGPASRERGQRARSKAYHADRSSAAARDRADHGPSGFMPMEFKTKDGKATFMETKWRGLQAPGKEAEKQKWPFLINNGRTNIVWQNAYLDQDNEFVMDRFPYPVHSK